MYGLFEPVQGSLFFYPFFTVVTLGLRQFHSASATRHISFRFLFGCHFRKEREKKIRENLEKETGAPADCCHWENQRKPHKYGDLAEEQPKEKREWTDARDRKDDLKTRLKTKRLSSFQIYIEKRKRRKRYAGEGKEKGTKMRSGLPIVRRTYRQVSGAKRE